MKFIIITLFYFFIVSNMLFSGEIHPNFNLSNSSFRQILSDEPEDVKDLILKSKYDFLVLIDSILQSEYSHLELVDKDNKLTKDYIPTDIINLTDYNLHTRYNNMPFSKVALKDFIQMSEDAMDDGIDLFIASTYRSYEFQEQIFNNMKNFHGEEKAATIVAYPGASQHQLGTAVDFGSITPSFANTDAGKWLLNNSWRYGFTISYPEGKEHITTYMWEPWHYRYIGKSAAIIQRNYFNDMQYYFLNFWNKYSLFFIESHIQ